MGITRRGWFRNKRSITHNYFHTNDRNLHSPCSSAFRVTLFVSKKPKRERENTPSHTSHHPTLTFFFRSPRSFPWPPSATGQTQNETEKKKRGDVFDFLLDLPNRKEKKQKNQTAYPPPSSTSLRPPFNPMQMSEFPTERLANISNSDIINIQIPSHLYNPLRAATPAFPSPPSSSLYLSRTTSLPIHSAILPVRDLKKTCIPRAGCPIRTHTIWHAYRSFGSVVTLGIIT